MSVVKACARFGGLDLESRLDQVVLAGTILVLEDVVPRCESLMVKFVQRRWPRRSDSSEIEFVATINLDLPSVASVTYFPINANDT